MIGLKDINEVLRYSYDVCEVYGCEEVADKLVERPDNRDLEVCSMHYQEIKYSFFI